jgi:hypothetical protein
MQVTPSSTLSATRTPGSAPCLRHDPRPRLPPRGVHCRGDPAQRPLASGGDLIQIAACLREVAERIEAGEAPRETCRRLAVYASELREVLRELGYLTAAGDASIDETRMRLAGEIIKAEAIWDVGAVSRDSVKLAGDDLVRGLALARAPLGKRNSAELSEAAIDELQSELAARSKSRTHKDVQHIWDAAGEFAALADALRAR